MTNTLRPKGFRKFQELVKQHHYIRKMGFHGGTGTVNLFANRVRLARAFKGIDLEGYTDLTISGYNALFQVFLTHSALELFMEINGILTRELDRLAPMMEPYDPEQVIQAFRACDPQRRFYSFVYDKVHDGLKSRLEACLAGESRNVAHLSAGIRHIFVHGYLTAHTNGARPNQVNSLCNCVSEFLLEFMDKEFTRKVEAYYDQVMAGESN